MTESDGSNSLGLPPEGYREFGDPWPPPRQRRSLGQWLKDTWEDWGPKWGQGRTDA